MIRFVMQLGAAIVLGLVVADFATWAYAKIYAARIGVPLHELSDDYGMGFDTMILGAGAFLITAIGLFAFFLHISKKNK